MAPDKGLFLPKGVLYYTLLTFLWISPTMALVISPSNDALPAQIVQQYMSSKNPMGSLPIHPLTPEVGLGGNTVSINTIKIDGYVVKAASNNIASIGEGDIALVNCDGITDTSSPISEIVQDISTRKPEAIVLYSLNSDHCAIENLTDYRSYYSTQQLHVQDAASFAAFKYEVEISATPLLDQTSQPPPTPKTSHTDDERSATPAVAMSILYAVTGIITVLFIIIIATGAWRAHTNPERYGPRASFAGRPRQSRAKGLARAMLETLPIVKFGDPIGKKGGSEDVEMNNTTPSDPRHDQRQPNSESVTGETQRKEVSSSGGAEATVTETTGNTNAPASKPQDPTVSVLESNTGCSICTEDFTKGEDVRVLPCNHQYHPACIDPWLLNVSGTCPLCRVDLRPVPEDLNEHSNGNNLTSPHGADEADHTHQPRVHRILALRHASVHERMATLRQLAREAGHEQQTQDGTASADDAIRQRRLADRLRSAFRIRTRRLSTTEASHSSPSSPPRDNGN